MRGGPGRALGGWCDVPGEGEDHPQEPLLGEGLVSSREQRRALPAVVLVWSVPVVLSRAPSPSGQSRSCWAKRPHHPLSPGRAGPGALTIRSWVAGHEGLCSEGGRVQRFCISS